MMKQKHAVYAAVLVVVILILFMVRRPPEEPEETKAGPVDCITEGQRGDSMMAPEKECCPGLKPISDLYVSKETKNCVVGGDESFVCAKCGDAICGRGENRCNCQEDCA